MRLVSRDPDARHVLATAKQTFRCRSFAQFKDEVRIGYPGDAEIAGLPTVWERWRDCFNTSNIFARDLDTPQHARADQNRMAHNDNRPESERARESNKQQRAVDAQPGDTPCDACAPPPDN